MKQLLGLAAAMLLCLTSCDKFVEPKTSEIDGDMAGCYELTGTKYQYAVNEGVGSFVVTIKRTEQSVPFASEVVAPFNNGNDKNYYLAGFGYTLFDKNGKEIYKTTPEESNLSVEEVEAILALNAGEEKTLTIKVSEDIKPAKVALTTGLEFCNSGSVVFEGSIDKYEVKNMTVVFDFEKNRIKGKYQYTSFPEGAYLWWEGKLEAEQLAQGEYVWAVTITETNDNGGWSGNFDGKLVLLRKSDNEQYFYSLPGVFTNFRYNEFETNLKSPMLSELYAQKDE